MTEALNLTQEEKDILKEIAIAYEQLVNEELFTLDTAKAQQQLDLLRERLGDDRYEEILGDFDLSTFIEYANAYNAISIPYNDTINIVDTVSREYHESFLKVINDFELIKRYNFNSHVLENFRVTLHECFAKKKVYDDHLRTTPDARLSQEVAMNQLLSQLASFDRGLGHIDSAAASKVDNALTGDFVLPKDSVFTFERTRTPEENNLINATANITAILTDVSKKIRDNVVIADTRGLLNNILDYSNAFLKAYNKVDLGRADPLMRTSIETVKTTLSNLVSIGLIKYNVRNNDGSDYFVLGDRDFSSLSNLSGVRDALKGFSIVGKPADNIPSQVTDILNASLAYVKARKEFFDINSAHPNFGAKRTAFINAIKTFVERKAVLDKSLKDNKDNKDNKDLTKKISNFVDFYSYILSIESDQSQFCKTGPTIARDGTATVRLKDNIIKDNCYSLSHEIEKNNYILAFQKENIRNFEMGYGEGEFTLGTMADDIVFNRKPRSKTPNTMKNSSLPDMFTLMELQESAVSKIDILSKTPSNKLIQETKDKVLKADSEYGKLKNQLTLAKRDPTVQFNLIPDQNNLNIINSNKDRIINLINGVDVNLFNPVLPRKLRYDDNVLKIAEVIQNVYNMAAPLTREIIDLKTNLTGINANIGVVATNIVSCDNDLNEMAKSVLMLYSPNLAAKINDADISGKKTDDLAQEYDNVRGTAEADGNILLLKHLDKALDFTKNLIRNAEAVRMYKPAIVELNDSSVPYFRNVNKTQVYLDNLKRFVNFNDDLTLGVNPYNKMKINRDKLCDKSVADLEKEYNEFLQLQYITARKYNGTISVDCPERKELERRANKVKELASKVNGVYNRNDRTRVNYNDIKIKLAGGEVSLRKAILGEGALGTFGSIDHPEGGSLLRGMQGYFTDPRADVEVFNHDNQVSKVIFDFASIVQEFDTNIDPIIRDINGFNANYDEFEVATIIDRLNPHLGGEKDIEKTTKSFLGLVNQVFLNKKPKPNSKDITEKYQDCIRKLTESIDNDNNFSLTPGFAKLKTLYNSALEKRNISGRDTSAAITEFVNDIIGAEPSDPYLKLAKNLYDSIFDADDPLLGADNIRNHVINHPEVFPGYIVEAMRGNTNGRSMGVLEDIANLIIEHKPIIDSSLPAVAAILAIGQEVFRDEVKHFNKICAYIKKFLDKATTIENAAIADFKANLTKTYNATMSALQFSPQELGFYALKKDVDAEILKLQAVLKQGSHQISENQPAILLSELEFNIDDEGKFTEISEKFNESIAQYKGYQKQDFDDALDNIETYRCIDRAKVNGEITKLKSLLESLGISIEDEQRQHQEVVPDDEEYEYEYEEEDKQEPEPESHPRDDNDRDYDDDDDSKPKGKRPHTTFGEQQSSRRGQTRVTTSYSDFSIRSVSEREIDDMFAGIQPYKISRSGEIEVSNTWPSEGVEQRARELYTYTAPIIASIQDFSEEVDPFSTSMVEAYSEGLNNVFSHDFGRLPASEKLECQAATFAVCDNMYKEVSKVGIEITNRYLQQEGIPENKMTLGDLSAIERLVGDTSKGTCMAMTIIPGSNRGKITGDMPGLDLGEHGFSALIDFQIEFGPEAKRIYERHPREFMELMSGTSDTIEFLARTGCKLIMPNGKVFEPQDVFDSLLKHRKNPGIFISCSNNKEAAKALTNMFKPARDRILEHNSIALTAGSRSY